MTTKNNETLRGDYDRIWRAGSGTFFTREGFDNGFDDSRLIFDFHRNWNGMKVLDIGSGDGRLGAILAIAGATVDGVDYSEEAVKKARAQFNLANLKFIHSDFRDIKEKYDAVTLSGALEHFDKPFEDLKFIIDTLLKDDGFVITSSPSFLNPRGYVWMTLQTLFDVPMSLTDLHFLCPFDFEEFCGREGLAMEYRSSSQSWGAGKRTIIDFDKRLRNALRDAKMDNTKVDRLLAWLEKAVRYHVDTDWSGAMVAYKIGRRKPNGENDE